MGVVNFFNLVLSMEMFGRVLLFGGGWEVSGGGRICIFFWLMARPSCLYAFANAVKVHCGPPLKGLH